MQLSAAGRLPLCALLVCLGGRAVAEQLPQNPSGEMQVRGSYWRDRNTRVINPTVDVHRDVPGGVSVGAHYVLDAITSASVAAGVTADQPFTELRHEAGFRVEVPLSRQVRLLGSYSYSTESDYWSHNAGLRVKLNLARDNTGILLGIDYGYNVAAKRLGPTGYLLQGRLDTVHLVALGTQVLGRRLLGTVSYELTLADGFQNNPYRPVFVGGERREVEKLPTLRVRHVLAASLHGMVLLPGPLVPHLTLRPAFRFHADSWGLKAFNPEIAASLPIGPVELRLLLGYYGQLEVDFYRSEGGGRRNFFDDTPGYASGPAMFNGEPVYTSDVKLGSYSTVTAELQIKWRLRVLSGVPLLGPTLERTTLELTGGLWGADRAVGWQFGIPLSPDDPQAPAGCSLRCAAFYANLGMIVPL